MDSERTEIAITPVTAPIRGAVRPPGSKSLTNRAMIVAALADGVSKLTGVLDSDDTRVMVNSLLRLGIEVRESNSNRTAEVTGCKGVPHAAQADLWLENSGTSIRFLTAVCALGNGTFRLDGNSRMRERPIMPLVTALKKLGVDVTCDNGTDCPPVTVKGHGLGGGSTSVAGNVSSQYLSGLLMAAPGAKGPIEIRVEGELVSEPYIEMTCSVMKAFGVEVETASPDLFRIRPQPYRAVQYDIEPDASAASYFFAAAAITGGEVRVDGLSRNSLQGDVRFVDVLEKMGCEVEYGPTSVTVRGGKLRGVEVDMNAISDTAQTLAATAVFAEGPTHIKHVAHMRHKETDRIEALATELRRLGQQVDVFEDGLRITPCPVQPATIETYDDHRMAMSFALVGLRVPKIRIADPECTAKTYPHFFDDLHRLCSGHP